MMALSMKSTMTIFCAVILSCAEARIGRRMNLNNGTTPASAGFATAPASEFPLSIPYEPAANHELNAMMNEVRRILHALEEKEEEISTKTAALENRLCAQLDMENKIIDELQGKVGALGRELEGRLNTLIREDTQVREMAKKEEENSRRIAELEVRLNTQAFAMEKKKGENSSDDVAALKKLLLFQGSKMEKLEGRLEKLFEAQAGASCWGW